MTKLLYQTDSYLQEFTAKVVDVSEQGVVLQETAFYPGGGGQPADAGVLTDAKGKTFPVTGLQRIEGKLIHLIPETDRPAVDDLVKGKIDWQRRYLLMRTHTALHILCGVIWRDYQAQVTGGNMEPGRGRLDFEFERMEARRRSKSPISSAPKSICCRRILKKCGWYTSLGWIYRQTGAPMWQIPGKWER
jgi:misacylated tRNA(Ala) deacylase